MSREVYTASVLRERWDDATRLYTAWNASGAQTSQRAYTAEENTAADAEAAALAIDTNRSGITTKAVNALAANDTYQAIASPSNAQVVAQVDLLTRECSGLIRLLLNRLDTTNGT